MAERGVCAGGADHLHTGETQWTEPRDVTAALRARGTPPGEGSDACTTESGRMLVQAMLVRGLSRDFGALDAAAGGAGAGAGAAQDADERGWEEEEEEQETPTLAMAAAQVGIRKHNAFFVFKRLTKLKRD